MIVITAHSADCSKHWHLWAGIVFTRTRKEVEAQQNKVPAEVTWLGSQTETEQSRRCNRQTPMSDFKNCTNCSWNFVVLKFLFQKVFMRRVYQYTSGSNAVVSENAGPSGLGSSGCFCPDRKEWACSLGQGSVTCVPWAGGVTHYAATLSHTCMVGSVSVTRVCWGAWHQWGPEVKMVYNINLFLQCWHAGIMWQRWLPGVQVPFGKSS